MYMKMRRILLLAALVAAVACGQKKSEPQKALVLYYSQSAGTKTVAETIQTLLGADIEAIVPVVPYDGTYQETVERGRQEREAGILPELQPLQADLNAYDVIFLGYPIWFGTYAPPMAALLEQVDLNGKKVVPFCTFGSGGLVASVAALRAKFPDAEILDGYGVRAARLAAVPSEVEKFLKQNGFLAGDVAPVADFSASHPASAEEAALFDQAVGDYPMINATATEAASRPVEGGTEYLFTAVDKPRDGAPQGEPAPFKVYVLALDGQAPEFTQVVR